MSHPTRHLAVALAVPGAAGKACEDTALAHVEGDAIVVADGLGSTGNGAQASQLAARLVLGRLRPRALGGARPDWLAKHLRTVFSAAVHGDRTIATTCIFFMLTDTDAHLGQVGDGLAVILRTNGEVIVRTGGRGDFANETAALPNSHIEMESWPADTIAAVLLATDGVSDDLLADSHEQLTRGWTELLAQQGPEHTALKLRAWLEDWKTPNSNDDRSVALLITTPGEMP